MKATFLIAASMLIGTAAIAQTTPDAATPSSTDATAPAPDAAMPGAAPSTGLNALPTPTTADMSTYPPCSRSVADHCVQTREMARKRR